MRLCGLDTAILENVDDHTRAAQAGIITSLKLLFFRMNEVIIIVAF